ncbi:MAG: hypothetical protein IMF11_09015 [Proteobacteria bacterium]|nr:hypothetical protein [Pseudomonadota bacterium]
MKTIIITRELGGGGSEVLYIPVPCRGNINSVKVASDATMVATGTLTVGRGGDTVNLVTAPTGNAAAGVVVDGVPDTTNKALIFDPDSVTAANKVIKLTDDATLHGGAATLTVVIEYDDSAYVEQVASEA